MIRLPHVSTQVMPARYPQNPSTRVSHPDQSTHPRLTGPFFLQQSNERGAAAYAAMQKIEINDQHEHFECYL